MMALAGLLVAGGLVGFGVLLTLWAACVIAKRTRV